MDPRYDTIVVGGRCAGAATAMLLARGGLRVLVIEAGRPGTETLSTHALMRGGVLQLDRWGLLDAVVAAGTPAIRYAEFVYGEQVETLDIRPGGGVCALYAPRRTLLDPLLLEAARAAGAEVRTAARVTGILTDEHGVYGVDGVQRGRPFRATAALTIGTDGPAPGPAPPAPGSRPCGPPASTSPTGPSSPRQTPRWPGRSTGHRRSAGCAASPACRAGSAAVRARAGRWSATPATSRTPSPRTASPTRCATRSCSPVPFSRPPATGRPGSPPSAATSEPATGSASPCSTSPNASPATTGTSSRYASTCGSSARPCAPRSTPCSSSTHRSARGLTTPPLSTRADRGDSPAGRGAQYELDVAHRSIWASVAYWSISASSSALRSRLDSPATLASNWRTLLAPMSTVVIRGSRSAHASASWASVCPRRSAIAFSARTRASVASVSIPRSSVPPVATRESAGMPPRYRSVSRPCASGENAMQPAPSAARVPSRSCCSIHRLNIE